MELLQSTQLSTNTVTADTLNVYTSLTPISHFRICVADLGKLSLWSNQRFGDFRNLQTSWIFSFLHAGESEARSTSLNLTPFTQHDFRRNGHRFRKQSSVFTCADIWWGAWHVTFNHHTYLNIAFKNHECSWRNDTMLNFPNVHSQWRIIWEKSQINQQVKGDIKRQQKRSQQTAKRLQIGI